MSDKSFWVIEAPWQPPQYLHAPEIGHHCAIRFTKDINEAWQFSRRQDAAKVFDFLMDPEWPFRPMIVGPGDLPRPVEHAYIEAR